MSESDRITVGVLVNTDLEKAWKCFVDPDCIVQWNFASPDWCCPKAVNDLRQGGRFNYRMEACDGSFGFDFDGLYTQVTEKALIAYRMDDGREVTIVFKAEGAATRVAETFDPEHENSLDLQRSGWQAILDNYRKVAESTE